MTELAEAQRAGAMEQHHPTGFRPALPQFGVDCLESRYDLFFVGPYINVSTWSHAFVVPGVIAHGAVNNTAAPQFGGTAQS
jgi:hypothetical protein